MKEGYKDSVLGAIPVEWDIKEINQVTSYVDYRGKTPPKVKEGTLLVTAKNIRKGWIDYEVSKEYIPTEEYDKVMSRGKPELGDVLITTEAPFGHVAAIDNENIALAQRVIKYRGNEGVLINSYLKHTLLSPYFQASLLKESTGSTVKGIKGSRLHKLKLLIPPLPEQQKIASILSTADQKIEVIDQQIAQTQELKKGLMQKLLTGQLSVVHNRPLSEAEMKDSVLGKIPVGWEVVKLDTLVNKKRPIRYGIVQTGNEIKDGIPCIRVIDFNYRVFDKEVMIKTSVDISNSYKTTILQEGDIVFPLRGRIGDVRIINENAIGANLTRGVALISNSENIYGDYLLWQLRSDRCRNEIRLKINGTTLKEIPIGGLKEIRIPIAPLPEQQKIASILSTVDDKIEVLQDKKAEYLELKKGLMQVLLTGKTRVKVEK